MAFYCWLGIVCFFKKSFLPTKMNVSELRRKEAKIDKTQTSRWTQNLTLWSPKNQIHSRENNDWEWRRTPKNLRYASYNIGVHVLNHLFFSSQYPSYVFNILKILLKFMSALHMNILWDWFYQSWFLTWICFHCPLWGLDARTLLTNFSSFISITCLWVNYYSYHFIWKEIIIKRS